MSTSTIVAQTDLSKQLPSCSYSTSSQMPSGPNRYDLDVDSWTKIFENVASSIPLKKALEFKTLHSVAYKAVNRALRNVTKLKIEVLEGTSTSYIVQDSMTKNAQTAVEMVRYVVTNAKCLKILEIYFEDANIEVVDKMLDEIINSTHVRLESFHVKRRHAGQTVAKIGHVIRQNASSLKEISRIGISEASIGFTDQLHLNRFGCMSFDLGIQPAPNQIPLHMIRITESGAKFNTFSYTSFAGLDPTDDLVQMLLEKCEVEDIKLTMMKSPKITSKPSYMIGKVRSVKRVQLVEIVPEPQRINKLIPVRHIFEKVFPAVENLLVLQQWN